MYVFCFLQVSLSTYTIEKVDGNSILPSFVYCMQIVLSSCLLQKVLHALSAIFSTFVSALILYLWCSWTEYSILNEVYSEVLFLPLLFLILYLS